MSIISSVRDRVQKKFSGDGRASAPFTASPRADYELVVNATSPRRLPSWRQLRYAGLVFSGREQRIIAFAAIIFAVAASLAGYAVFRDRMSAAPAPGGKIIEAVVGAPKGINPLYASANDPDADLSALVFAGLFRRVDGTLANDLADKYEWSADGKQVTITLKDGLSFHDGMPLTSEDVLFTLQSAKDPAWRSPFAGDFRDATFGAPDEKTVVITLGAPDASILDALTIGILPAHVWSDILPQNAALADANVRPVGAGPFKVSSYRHGSNGAIQTYALERFDGYRGERPLLDGIELRFYPDPKSAEDAVRGGQADAIAFVPGADAKKFPATAFNDSKLALPQETISFFNVNDPILKDSRVREALLLAVDRDEITNAFGGFATPIGGPYPDDVHPSSASSTEERLAAARKLLDAAGWTLSDGSDVRSKTSSATSTAAAPPLALTITVPDVPDLIAAADALARRWSLLNARTAVQAESSADVLRKATRDRNAQIVLWNILLPATEDQYSIWWSGEADGSGFNISNLKDRDVDAAIKEIGSASSTDALAAAKKKLTSAILARSPAAFLVRPSYAYVFSKRIQGIPEEMSLGSTSDRFTSIAKWYVKTKWEWKR
jgi:peptide/nickel transport system substrate-binding protein